MIGVVLILLVMFVVGPIGLFVVGARLVGAAPAGCSSDDADAARRRQPSYAASSLTSRGCVAPGQRVWPKR